MTTLTEAFTGTYTEQRTTQELPMITMRVIRPNDIDLLCAMHQRLSAESIYFRYLQYKIPALDELEAVCQITAGKGAAMVATLHSGMDGNASESMIAIAYYICDAVKNENCDPQPSAEVAILVEDHFQGQGIGRMVWQALHQHAQSEGMHSLRVLFDPANYRMLRMIKSSGYPYVASAEGDLNDFLVLLQEQPQLSKVQKLLEKFGRPILQRLASSRLQHEVGNR